MEAIVCIASREGHNRIGMTQRSHGYLCTIYDMLQVDIPNISKEERLSMTLPAINDSPPAQSVIAPATMAFGICPKSPTEGSEVQL